MASHEEPPLTAAGARGPIRKLGLLPSFLCQRFLSMVRLDPGAIEHVRELAQQGSVVYVMRYRSLVDFLLIVHVLLRERLPVPEFVSDIPTLLLRPLREIVPELWRRLRLARWRVGREMRQGEDRDRCERLVAEGRPVLIFMRSQAPAVPLSLPREVALRGVRTGTDYLREIVHAGVSQERDVFLVPLAVLRGRGFRKKGSRLSALAYSVREAPGELRRMVSLAWNAQHTSITVGKHIPLQEFMRSHQAEGEERIVRRLARVLQIFLHREERVVWGPTLLPKRQVRQMVLQGDELRDLIRQTALAENVPESQLWRRAEKYFDEIAANYNGFYFAVLEYLFNKLWPRMFLGFQYEGLEKVIECVKQHPVVLVPCHRSHFDYLILSYLFHENYLSPPHIAAGINLSFWPLGPLFRGAGAYFIRRSFDGNHVYKMVFRNYLAYLIREGYTQEFFIEGGRSRTGKILTPKLGVLTAIVDAYISGVRRDLYFVPVSIHYGRIVEEQAYSRELKGGEKQEESLGALLQARKVLGQRYGTVYVTFADPISLGDSLGGRREEFQAAAGDTAREEEKRRFIQKLGFRILRDVNNVTVAGATSVSATVLLASPHAAMRYRDYLASAQAAARFLDHSKVRLTDSLRRNLPDFRESLWFLESAELVERVAGDDDLIRVPAAKRLSLDFYKNNTIHFFLIPGLLVRALRDGKRGEDACDELMWWLDLLRWEFALPERSAVASEAAELQTYLRSIGVIDGDDQISPEHPLVLPLAGLVDNLAEAYLVMARTLASLSPDGATQKALIAAAQKRYEAELLLGEVRRPEGNTTVTLGNALNRFAEVGYVDSVAGSRPRERNLKPGPRYAGLSELIDRLTAGLR